MPAPDRPANEEIEVSPAMIEAGVRAYADFDVEFDSVGELVSDVFKAMMRAGRQHSAVNTPE